MINIKALQHNLDRVSYYAPNSRVLAVIKSNAYGHGLLPVARALKKADALGVADFYEAQQLRDAGIDQPIVVMYDLVTYERLHWAAQCDVHVVLSHCKQLEQVCAHPLPSPLKIWLELETGMHRLGWDSNDIQEALDRLKRCPWIDPNVVLMSHLSFSEQLEDVRTQRQIDNFLRISQEFYGLCSLANSAAVLARSQTHLNWVRPGRMLYGISPFAHHSGADYGLQPVMTFDANLLAIYSRRYGDCLGYGLSSVCPQDMLVGVVAAGYGSGYPLSAPLGTPVLLHGVRCPLVAQVAMNLLIIDISAVSSAQIGDRVILWGDDLPVEHVAQWVGTMPLDLLCGVRAGASWRNEAPPHGFCDHVHGRVRWRARTGMRELDLLLQPFLDTGYPQLNAQERLIFEKWLEAGDANLFAWLIKKEPAPPPWTSLVEKVRNFSQSHHLY